MKTRTKVLIGVIIVLFVALPLMTSVLASEGQTNEASDGSNLTGLERIRQFMVKEWAQSRMIAVARQYLSGAEVATIEGKVISNYKTILIIDSNGKRLNVVLPRIWNLNSEVLNASQMCERYFNNGQSVSVMTLIRQYNNKNNVTLTIFLAYKITTEENHFHAIMPFNIDTND